MAIGRKGSAERQLSTLFYVGATGGLTDGQLLEQFARRSEEGAELAFAILVERHGPLVLRVCRSILRDDHAAHDAFQATFLVLVEKCRSLRVEESLAPWLHAVAYRVALCARGAAARRRGHEQARAKVTPLQALDQIAGARELGEVLHEEIEALPERYRVPIVLCDLEGRSHDEAARHLGWPVGTVKSRQARGRDRLRARLERRGVAISARPGMISGAGVEVASPQMVRSTAALAVRSLANGVGAASAPAASLAKEVLMNLLIGKLKWAGVAILTLAITATGALALAFGGGKGPIPLVRTFKTIMVRDEAPPERPKRIYFGSNQDGLVAADPKTGETTRVSIQCKNSPRISPDGRLVAFEWQGSVWVRELEKAVVARKLLELDGATFEALPVWSHDGSKLIVSLGKKEAAAVKGRNDWRFKTVRINLDGTGREELKLPPDDHVLDWSAGDWFVTASSRNAQAFWQLYVMKSDGSGQRQVTEGGNPVHARFSPDGKRVLYTDMGSEDRVGIWVVGLDGKDRSRVLALTRVYTPQACWSPDGKKIAAIAIDRRRVGIPPKARLVLKDVDGENRSEFPLDDLVDDPEQTNTPDWR